MNYLNEYQRHRELFYSMSKNKNSSYITYENWYSITIHDQLGMGISPNEMINMERNISKSYSNIYNNEEKHKKQKLSTKERLRKKLLERRQKLLEKL